VVVSFEHEDPMEKEDLKELCVYTNGVVALRRRDPRIVKGPVLISFVTSDWPHKKQRGGNNGTQTSGAWKSVHQYIHDASI
jgi:hypothetical protein